MGNTGYLGKFLTNIEKEKDRKKRARHPIFLYSPDGAERDSKLFHRLNQIVNIYDHTIEDFEFNAKRIISHYTNYYGDTTIGMFTLGQSISFRVVEGQEPFRLPLFKFLMNYTMIILPIIVGADMTNWRPWTPVRWTSSAWCKQMDVYIEQCRHLGNMRRICECLEMSKFLMNLWASEAGDRIALSISNNDFIEVAKRSRDAYESLTCTFPIPENITPPELESLARARTTDLINFISEQEDLPISIYTKNGLFNPAQFKEFAVHMTHKPDLYGNTIPYTSNTNIIMGTADPRAHTIDAYGGRKAETTKLNVSDAGALERSLAMMMSKVRFVDIDYECDSKHFRKRKISSADILNKLDGRVCTLDPKSDEYLIIDPKNHDLIGKTAYLKTPITCTHPKRSEGYICSACYGKLLSNLNCDVHVGKLSALNSADDIEQKLLSAKHALETNTQPIIFDEAFDVYFDIENCRILFSQDMIDASAEGNEDFNHLYLEFHPGVMHKYQDGEGRQYDRSTSEIVIYDDRDGLCNVIREENGLELFLSPDFVNDFFLPALRHTNEKRGVIRIPFKDLIDTGEVMCDVIFEYEHPNVEIAAALLTLEGILIKGSRINSFKDYDECLDTLIPLFIKGGIHIPELQCEMLITQMIYTKDRTLVNWEEADPEYMFYTIDKSVQNLDSALTSVLYRESASQIAGAYGTYEKEGVSAYDWYILERGSTHTSTQE